MKYIDSILKILGWLNFKNLFGFTQKFAYYNVQGLKNKSSGSLYLPNKVSSSRIYAFNQNEKANLPGERMSRKKFRSKGKTAFRSFRHLNRTSYWNYFVLTANVDKKSFDKSKLPVQTIEINHLLEPAIYGIFCKNEKKVYIGQSKIVLKRIGMHVSHLNIEVKHSEEFIKDYKKYGLKNFEVIILQKEGCDTEEKRLKLEGLYMIKYRETMNYKLYNRWLDLELNEKAFKEISSLQCLNQDISFLFEPGIYQIKNKLNNWVYMGKALVLVSWLYDHLEFFEKNKENKKKTPFQDDLFKNQKESFIFKILHYGEKFKENSYRLKVEKFYIKKYIKNSYNSFKQVLGVLKPLKSNTRDMPVYILDTKNQPLKFSTIKDAQNFLKYKNDRQIRAALDSKESNKTVFYRWSYGWNSFTTFVKLIVKNRNEIFFNESIMASNSPGETSVTVAKNCARTNKDKKTKKNNNFFDFLNDFSFEEKVEIPNLIFKVVRETRWTIDIPLDMKNPVDFDLSNTQSITYPKSEFDKPKFHQISLKDKKEAFYLLKSRIFSLLDISASDSDTNETLSNKIVLAQEILDFLEENYSNWLT